MRCNYCHSEIEEYIVHKNQNPKGKILRKLECPLCGPLNYLTLVPVQKEGIINQ